MNLIENQRTIVLQKENTKNIQSKTLKTVMKHFNELKENMGELPDAIKDHVKKLDKKIDRVLEQVKDKNIPKTNNLVSYF